MQRCPGRRARDGRFGALTWVLMCVGLVSLPAVSCKDESDDASNEEAAEAGDDDDDDDDDADDDDDDEESGDDDDDAEDTAAPPLPDFPCEDRSECVLHSDCCSCVALHEDEEPPECDDTSCMRGECDVWGIERLLCSHTCHIELVECDAAMVTCPDEPPECEDGFVPSVDERCWSLHCVPEYLCRP